ncbi:MAG: FecCD family ABC transporter permease [Hyphomicrobiaceae bacterium]
MATNIGAADGPVDDLVSPRELTGRRLMLASIVALVVACIISMGTGSTGVQLTALPGAIASSLGYSAEPADVRASLVLIDLRLPRTLLAIFVGGSLAVAGAMMQGLFRNPLADPGLVGVSSGATLAAVTFIVLGNTYLGGWQALMGIYALPVAAFGGGLVATVVLMGVASRHGGTAVATLLLAGIALGALTGALTGILAYVSNDRELRDLTLWSMGSFSGSSWSKAAAIAPFAFILLVALPGLVRALNGMLLGEAEAYHLGIDLESAKRKVVLLTAMAVGGSVAVAGIIGFVGIVIPHCVRMIAGPDHRIVLPASTLLGAALVLGADVISRVIVAPAELPIGIIMAIIGAPVFLHLVLKRSSAVAF